MVSFLGRRLISMAVTLFLASIVGFVLIELPPGSYLDLELQRLRQLGGNLSGDQIAFLEARYGVNDPLPVKYGKWVSGVLRGDFGESFEYKAEVGPLIWGRLGFSLLISFTALVAVWLIAIPIGVFSATHRYSLPDYIITVLQFVGISVPNFLLALVMMIFAVRVLNMDIGGLFSAAYRDAPWSVGKILDLANHMWIPVLVVSVGSTAWLTRVMRANLLDVLNMQYVQAARAKGLAERVVIWKHAVRNALHPLVMTLGAVLPALISGELITSVVLNLPTIGPLYLRALLQKDMYLAITILMLLAVALMIGNLFADILLVWLDPRIRLE